MAGFAFLIAIGGVVVAIVGGVLAADIYTEVLPELAAEIASKVAAMAPRKPRMHKTHRMPLSNEMPGPRTGSYSDHPGDCQ